MRHTPLFIIALLVAAPAAICTQPKLNELPELVVDGKSRNILHLLGYVREYSTLASYTDTVTLCRIKWVDFMIPTTSDAKIEGWKTPRILSVRSYYNFRNAQGLDSVSDRYCRHFSWTDWVRLNNRMPIPENIRKSEIAVDTVFGKYQPGEIWSREHDRISVHLDALADSTPRRWLPRMAPFFRDNTNFERVTFDYNFSTSEPLYVFPRDLTSITLNVDARFPGSEMFLWKKDQPAFTTTSAQIYIVDREYVTAKEARKYAKERLTAEHTDLLPIPDWVPDVDSATEILIARVNALNHDSIHVNRLSDKRLSGFDLEERYRWMHRSFGSRIFDMLKALTKMPKAAFNQTFYPNRHE